MVLPPSDDKRGPGVIDFQDALRGPIGYDLVSLLKDCYISWSRERVERWVRGYRRVLGNLGANVGDSEYQFMRWFDLIGVQRHVKVLGIFARLWHRDGKIGYLADLPLVLELRARRLPPISRARRVRTLARVARRAAAADRECARDGASQRGASRRRREGAAQGQAQRPGREDQGEARRRKAKRKAQIASVKRQVEAQSCTAKRKVRDRKRSQIAQARASSAQDVRGAQTRRSPASDAAAPT